MKDGGGDSHNPLLVLEGEAEIRAIADAAVLVQRYAEGSSDAQHFLFRDFATTLAAQTAIAVAWLEGRSEQVFVELEGGETWYSIAPPLLREVEGVKICAVNNPLGLTVRLLRHAEQYTEDPDAKGVLRTMLQGYDTTRGH